MNCLHSLPVFRSMQLKVYRLVGQLSSSFPCPISAKEEGDEQVLLSNLISLGNIYSSVCLSTRFGLCVSRWLCVCVCRSIRVDTSRKERRKKRPGRVKNMIVDGECNMIYDNQMWMARRHTHTADDKYIYKNQQQLRGFGPRSTHTHTPMEMTYLRTSSGRSCIDSWSASSKSISHSSCLSLSLWNIKL